MNWFCFLEMICCVPGCDKYSGMSNKFSRLPKEKAILDIWLKNINNPSLFGLEEKKYKNYAVCTRHFAAECINTSAVNTQKCIKKGSIPTLFLAGSK